MLKQLNHIAPEHLLSFPRQKQAEADYGVQRMAKFMMVALFFAAGLMLSLGQSQAADRPDSFADLAEALTPSVVNISTTTVVESRGGGSQLPQFPEGSPFEDFFRDFENQDRPRRAQSLGSGFIIDKEGYVVTNNHVIENADEITIYLSDDDSFSAKIVGRDEKQISRF